MPAIKMSATKTSIAYKTTRNNSAPDKDASGGQKKKACTLTKRQQQALSNFWYGKEDDTKTLQPLPNVST
jgi:hypothetical protein